ncbi:thiamin pyrophosphokinase 1 [Drosophila ficusphila]|uniref:thiamin pyrophosphokinase 1 n=1 Tax=Drosophila ficusphila TaxID=30025 RepID=UPI0007E82087|nr:thiamin pyrophosphokinase 1 [Drosophila ficusphila]
MIFIQYYGTRCRTMKPPSGAAAALNLMRRSGRGFAFVRLARVGRPTHHHHTTHSPPTNHRFLCTKTTIGFRQQMDHTIPPKEFKWTPGNLINENFKLGDNGHVCMVLNRQIQVPAHVVKLLWKNAAVRCAVDGGSNHWRDFVVDQAMSKKSTGSGATTPLEPLDVITGDFDSITEETVDFFKTTPKVHTPDQDATDFTKAIAVLQPVMAQRKVRDVVVFHDTSGRLDHVMANLNTLYKTQKDNCNVFLLSGDSVTWLLRPGKHTIQVPTDLVTSQRWCSLMPVGSSAHNVTTTGLKWNLYHAQMEFGGMVSTSNTYSTEFVQVETDANLIWSMGAYEFEAKIRQAANT